MSHKAIFLDRDGTIIEDPGYINSPEQVTVLEGAAEALSQLKSLGYKLVVVSNQSAVARGMVTEKTLTKIHKRLKQLLNQKGVSLDGIYYCPYHPDGTVAEYRKQSQLRKPNPGMLLKAAKEIDIDLGLSWTIGDSDRDIEAGQRAGTKTILIQNSSQNKQTLPGRAQPDHKAVNITEAVNIIKKHLRSSHHQPNSDTATTNPESIEQPEEVKNAVEQQPLASQIGAPQGQIDSQTAEQLLGSILDQIKTMRRNEMFEEFSITRMLAGLVQVVVLLCLMMSIFFLMSPTRENNSVYISIGFAAVLQVMALTLYLMERRK